MYSTHNEGKSVIAERFTKTLKSNIYKKVTANDNKSYLPYLKKVRRSIQCYLHFINKKPIYADYSAFT